MFGVDRVDPALMQRVDAIKSGFLARDRRAAEVRAVRKGDFDLIAPLAFNEEWPRPIVANMINTIAQHAAAALSPLPSISCSSPRMTSDAARKSADRRTKIANHYYKHSDVRSQRQMAADQFYTYGLMVASVEPDWEDKLPGVFYEDSIGFYPVWDRRGRTVEVVREFDRRIVELQAEFPNLSDQLAKANLGVHGSGADATVRVQKYENAKRISMYLPDLGGAVLYDFDNPMGRCTYVCTKKPSLDQEIQGTFDDLIWVQIARHTMQMLALEAGANAVEAPIVVPTDVGDVPMGPNAIIRTNTPGGVGRLHMEVPNAIWQSIAHLKDEMQSGAISPQALGGSIDASVVTGRGVQELMAGYSQQVAMCQETILTHDEQVLDLCFDMDEKFWPDAPKKIQGRLEGAQYQLTYTPSKDIAGDRTVDVVYGGVKGLDPNRGLVYLLQTLGADLVSKDYVRRTVDADINPGEEESKIALEKVRDSILQGTSAYLQSIPQMVLQGQDPSQMLANAVAIAKALQRGETLEDAMEKVFPPPPPPEAQPAAAAPGMPGVPGAPGEPGAGASPFTPAPGAAATAGPGGRPDMAQFFAGMSSSGRPNLSAGISRMVPAGG